VALMQDLKYVGFGVLIPSNERLYNFLFNMLSNAVLIYFNAYEIITIQQPVINEDIQIEEDLLGNDASTLYINNKFISTIYNNDNKCLNFPYQSQYIKDNYIPNACLYSIIIDTYKEKFIGYNTFVLTYENLYNYINSKKSNCNYKFDKSDSNKECLKISLNTDFKDTLKNFKCFFEEFKLGLEVININNKIIYEYKPKSVNHHISPCVLKLLLHNNHVYKINNDVSFNRTSKQALTGYYNEKIKDIDDLDDNTDDIKTSPYSINKGDVIIYDEYKNISQILNFIDLYDKTDDIKKNYIYLSNDLALVLKDVLDNLKYTPKLKFTGGELSHIYVCITKNIIKNKQKIQVKILINIFSEIEDLNHDSSAELNNFDKYIESDKYFNEFYKLLINKKNRSNYNENFHMWLLEYRPLPDYGSFDKIFNGFTLEKNKKIFELDFNKAYINCLRSIKNFPVFQYFCEPEQYDNHEIKNETLYLIEVKIMCMLFNKKYTLIYGSNLSRLKKDRYIILEFCEPSYTSENNCDNFLRKLYADPNEFLETGENKKNDDGTDYIDRSGKPVKEFIKRKDLYKDTINLNNQSVKFIGNKTIGLLGKIFVKNEKGIYCKTLNEVNRLIETEGGYAYSIDNPNDNNDVIGYYHIKENNRLLINGFLAIHTYIYDTMRMCLYTYINKLNKLNINVIGVKTDAIYVTGDESILNILKSKFEGKHDKNYYDGIGELKIKEMNMGFQMPKIERIENSLSDYKTIIKINKYSLDDEYNIDYLKISNNTIIMSDIAGCGKSNLCKKYSEFHNKNPLFVVKNNLLCNYIKEEGFKSTTPNKLLGIGCELNDDSIKSKFNLEGINLIVFEEIFFNESWLLELLYKFMLSHPEITFLANGDPSQLEIDEIITKDKKTSYILKMFPNVLKLKIIKRAENNEYYDIYNYISNSKDSESKQFNYIINTWFKSNITNTVKTSTGLTYTHEIQDLFNKKIHSSKTKNNKYYFIGLKLIIKKWCKLFVLSENQKKHIIFNTNFTYEITDVIENNNNIIKLSIKDIFTDEIYIVDIKDIENNFRLPYISTIHSTQGMTIKKPYTIFISKKSPLNIALLWVAITRANNIKNIFITYVE
jgi:hypothetical protein